MIGFFKRDLEDSIVSFFKRNYSEIKLLAVVFLLEVIIYGQKATSHSLAFDDYNRIHYGWTHHPTWYGRWLNEIISGSVLSGPMHILPYGHFVGGLFFVTLSAYLGVKLFNQHSAVSKVVFILLCTVSPFWAENFFYNTNFVVWVFNFVGVYGFYLVLGSESRKQKNIRWLLALLFITAAISVYQAILQGLLVILLFRIVFQIFDIDDPKDIFSIAFKNLPYLVLLVLSFFSIA